MQTVRHWKHYSAVLCPEPPSRYTVSEWYLHCNVGKRCSLDQRKQAEKVLAKSDRVADRALERSKVTKREVDHILQVRLDDVKFLRAELLNRRGDIVNEMSCLETYITRLVDFINYMVNPTEICRKCLIMREGRLGIDLVHDEVEKELHHEIEVIEGVKGILRNLDDQANEEMRLLRAVLYAIDRNLEDKDDAILIDHRNTILNEKSPNLKMYHGFSPLNPANISIEHWDNNSQKTIADADKQLYGSRKLRGFIDTLMKGATDDLIAQRNRVNVAFDLRIKQTKEVKENSESLLCEISQKCSEMSKNITNLEKAIQEKEPYMALAHTRLGNRAHRRNMELCMDKVETWLVNEVAEVRDDVAMLQKMLQEAHSSSRALRKTQINLQEDINVKNNTIKIDEVDCMTTRQVLIYGYY